MALYNLIGRRQRHDVIEAVPLLAEKLREIVFPTSILALISDLSSTFWLKWM